MRRFSGRNFLAKSARILPLGGVVGVRFRRDDWRAERGLAGAVSSAIRQPAWQTLRALSEPDLAEHFKHHRGSRLGGPLQAPSPHLSKPSQPASRTPQLAAHQYRRRGGLQRGAPCPIDGIYFHLFFGDPDSHPRLQSPPVFDMAADTHRSASSAGNGIP
jgi:hypothetical protein